MEDWREYLRSLIPKEGPMMGSGELLATLGTGAAGMAAGGLRGLGAGARAAWQAEPGDRANAFAGASGAAVADTMGRMTYQPRSASGQAALAPVAKVGELWGRMAEAAGGAGWSPASQTAIQTAVENADVLIAPAKALAIGGKAALAAAPLLARRLPGEVAGATGKHIGGERYVHRSAVGDLPPEVQAKIAAAEVPFDWHVAKVDKGGGVSLMESTDFDSADFPTIGHTMRLDTGKVSKPLLDPYIYHHKQTMTRPDYAGFDRARADAISAELMGMEGVDRARYGRKSFMEANVSPRLTSLQRGLVDDRPSLWDAPSQKVSSADTSINSGKLPGGFTAAEKLGLIEKGQRVIDIGGGRFDNAVEWGKGKGIHVGVFDPFNRAKAHNEKVVAEFAGGKSDVATINNVLNVIEEPANQLRVLRQAEDALRPGGRVVIKIYEGAGDGAAKATSKGFQQNKKTGDYLELVRQVFPDAEVKGGVIVASRGTGAVPDKAVLTAIEGGNDGIMRGILADEPAKNAPFPQHADRYPDVAPPVEKTDPKSGKSYLGKGTTPENEEFMRARLAAQKDMESSGYPAYFDPEKRFDAEKSSYLAPEETIFTSKAKTEKTVEKWRGVVQTDDARARLQEAFDAGNKAGYHDRWYEMGQLEKEFIDELGPVEGPKAFRRRFSESMAATTGGADPTSNLMMAGYGNYLRAHGMPVPQNAYSMPNPIGGRYVTGNMAMFDKVDGVGVTADTPKRYNFARNFEGHKDRSTIDEQMTDLITPGKLSPADGSYFAYEELIAEMARKNGVTPREFQDIAWGGKKALTTGGKYEGKPMIGHVNDAIERTHRLTGRSRAEIVRKGLVRGQIPIYGAGAAAVLPGLFSEERRKGGT